MGRLIYSALASIDGYVADEHGDFGWAAPDDQVHAFVNDLTRPVGTHLLGRRMYEVMVAWETLDVTGEPEPMRDFAEIWRAADKVVFSSTLDEVASAGTRIERRFDPDAVRTLVDAAVRDVAIAGPTLAAHAFTAGLVDEVQLFVAPVLVGGGLRALPDGVRMELELVDERRFDAGMVYLRYVRGGPPA